MQFELRPMLATLTDKPFDDPDWVFETKWDGFRAIAVAKPGQAALYSRNLNDISRKYPSICAALAKIKHEAVLDGELVALDEHGAIALSAVAERRAGVCAAALLCVRSALSRR
jgi:bifunctional non-homologous end joining protein LigD